MRGRHLTSLGLIAALAISSCAAVSLSDTASAQGFPGVAGGPGGGQPVLFGADTVNYDENLDVVTLTGNVEIAQGQRVVQADTVTYNQRANTVTASGNVRLLEPSGEVLFANYVELQDEMKAGVIRDIGVLLTDNSRIVANSAVRENGNRTTMRQAVYSPCDLCAEDPNAAPIWQLKANRIIHDQESQDVIYYNAFLEFFGFPVFWTPYLTHPDPTVERRSGFLAPSFGQSGSLGFRFQIPYYWSISQDMDATFEPIFLTDAGVVGSGEFRKRFSFGEVEVAGSFGRIDRLNSDGTIDRNANRGHIKTEGKFDLTDNWRVGFTGERASDDTYMRRLGLSTEQLLESRLYAEGFYGRSYAYAETAAFQGLRSADDVDTTPLLAPRVMYNYLGNADSFGGRLSFDASGLVLTRREGAEMARASIGARYRLPLLTSGGHAFTLEASARGDVYSTNNLEQPDGTISDNATKARLFPQLSAEWKYPLARHFENVSVVVEPKASIVVAPTGLNPDEIGNEDSSNFELDEVNLFEPNRLPGLDRVDEGTRVNYGVTASMIGDRGQYSMFLGQSYRLDEGTPFTNGTGANENLSDLVAQIDATPSPLLDLNYRARFDNDSLALRRQELSLSAGPSIARLNLTYNFLDNLSTPDLIGDREEVTASISSQFADHWQASASLRRDIQNEDFRNIGAGLRYADECLIIDATYVRSFFRDRDLEPDNSFFVRFTLKNLGEFGTGG